MRVTNDLQQRHSITGEISSHSYQIFNMLNPQVHCCMLKVACAQAVFEAACAPLEGDSALDGWRICANREQEISVTFC